jgi:hypothetical protein
MATVSVTEKFLSAVGDHIDNMRRDDININTKQISRLTGVELGGKEVPFIHRLMWGEHHHLIDTVPSTWINHDDDGVLNIHHNRVNDKGFRCSVGVNLNFVDVKLRRPPNFSTYKTIEVRTDADYFREALANPVFSHEARMILDVADRALQANQLGKKWDATKNQVKAFFRAFKTLNTALKHTPSMVLYVPKEHIDRMNKSSATRTRQTTDSEIPEFDADALAAQAVTLKLQQSVGA